MRNPNKMCVYVLNKAYVLLLQLNTIAEIKGNK